MGAITKSDLAKGIAGQIRMKQGDAQLLVDTIFSEIKNDLENGVKVKLSGFGNFNLRDKSQRPGRNPRTGEPVAISPRRVVTFHVGQKLKAQNAGLELNAILN